jgi:hypothetical protein
MAMVFFIVMLMATTCFVNGFNRLAG